MEDATPRAFLCPISHELMHDPVCVADGHTYEREHIERWLTTSLTSPATGQALAHTALVRNHALRQATEEHLQICVRRGEDWAVDLLNRARQPLGERDDVRKLEEEMNAAAKAAASAAEVSWRAVQRFHVERQRAEQLSVQVRAEREMAEALSEVLLRELRLVDA